MAGDDHPTPLDELWQALFPPPYAPVPEDSTLYREQILSFGQQHDDAVAALERLADAHGGTLAGAATGLLQLFADKGEITTGDQPRLQQIFDAALAQPVTTDAAMAAAAQSIDDILADAASSDQAVRLASLARAGLTSPLFAVTTITGADLLGALLGGPGGPISAYFTGSAASHANEAAQSMAMIIVTP